MATSTGAENKVEEEKATGKTEGDKQDGESQMSDERREYLMDYFSKALGISTAPPPVSRLDEVTFEGIAKYIASDKCQKIVTMTGAGISTSAGIPDFRSPGTGLYDNLKKYNLKEPTEAFSIDYFKENPEPFYMIRKEMFGKPYKPTPCHYFLELLDKKNKLMRHFTQNVDGLERKTGLSSEKLIEAHGTMTTGHCMECNHSYDHKRISDKVSDKTAKSHVPHCDQPECNGVIRPDIVMFGETLPQRFVDHADEIKDCDCLIVMGTSLVVQPFASITNRTKDDVPRLYINMEKTGGGTSHHPLTLLMFGGGFDFDKEDNIRDVFKQGTCDDGCYALADLIGWGAEFRNMIKAGNEKLDRLYGTAATKSGPRVTGASNKPLTASSSTKSVTPRVTGPGKTTAAQGSVRKTPTQPQKTVPSKTPAKTTPNTSVKKPNSASSKTCQTSAAKK